MKIYLLNKTGWADKDKVMNEIEKNLETVRRRIEVAARDADRKASDIKLLAVTKKKPITIVQEAYRAGQKSFGENYVQELREKHDKMAEKDIEWHFIGHLQRNKVKYIVPFVKAIHSINSLKLAEEIEKRAEKVIDCFVEVNISEEESKSGIEKDDINELVKEINHMEQINLKGLMTMPPFSENPEDSRPYFIQLREIMNKINDTDLYKKPLTDLSMGMTNDFGVAIEEGATMVRIGTAIFGER